MRSPTGLLVGIGMLALAARLSAAELYPEAKTFEPVPFQAYPALSANLADYEWDGDAPAASPPAANGAAAVGQLGIQLQTLAENLRVTTSQPGVNVVLFGTLSGEMLFSTDRPVAPEAPCFLTPDLGLEQDSVALHGKSTSFGMLVVGPEIWGFQSGGMIYCFFFGNTVLNNTSGVFFAQGFAELKDDVWRFAAGLQMDIINPINPTTINFGLEYGAGNVGFLRGQFRLERYFYTSDDVQWTAQIGLSEPVTNQFSTSNEVALTEDNGWPNVEGRLALGIGPLCGQGLDAHRPAEFGVSGMVGELRTTDSAATRVEDNTWAVGADFKVEVTETIGVKGELFRGKGIGSYNGAVIQTINLDTFETIDASGGWGEVYVYWTPCLHSHLGYGIDDPDNGDLSTGQRLRNEVVFGNLIWDITDQFQVGFEVSHYETDYVDLPDNDGMVYHARVQYKF